MKDYRPGGTITLDGVEYKIDSMQQTASIDNGVIRVTTHVRTLPNPEVIEFTVMPDVRKLR